MQIGLIGGLLLSLFATVAFGQSYPMRPIRLIVPLTPGSTSDVTARVIAQKISGPLGQPVIVENRPGANGGIAMQAVARSKPDGYTFAVGVVSTTVIPAVISKTELFDLFKDFVAVTTIANTPLLMSVAQDSPIGSVADLIAVAKNSPGTTTYGNSAGLYQLAMEALNQQANIDLLAVAFKGPVDATNELIAGRLTVNPDALGSAAPMIRAKRIRPLAILGSKRTNALPSVPTMTELGFKGFDFNGWVGILAPTGTPPQIVKRIYQEIAKAVESDEVKQLYENLGLEPVSLSPHVYHETLVRDMATYKAIASAAKIEKR